MSEQSNFETLEDDVQEMRDQILIATLPHVPFDGWTERAMTAGEASTGLGEGAAYRLQMMQNPANNVTHCVGLPRMASLYCTGSASTASATNLRSRAAELRFLSP